MPLAFGRLTSSQFILSGWSECNTISIRYAVRRLPWSLPVYDARCVLIDLRVLSDREITMVVTGL
jgi:hypothetical protein